jgi:hypothetical protein
MLLESHAQWTNCPIEGMFPDRIVPILIVMAHDFMINARPLGGDAAAFGAS